MNVETANEFSGFEWDKGNLEKNKKSHDVENYECEQIFFGSPLIIIPDEKHSIGESRYAAFGRSLRGRLLTVVFTKRNDKIRVISARDMNKREREFYGNHEKENSDL
jgi:hypothetical protein